MIRGAITKNGDQSYLELKSISKAFGGLAAVNNLSFNLAEGSILSIIGPNGAGKTTVINLITKVLSPSGGEIWLRGREITKLKPHGICKLGVARTFQDLQLFTNMSVVENVMVGCQRWRRATLPETILHVGRFKQDEKEHFDRAMSKLSLFGMEGRAFEKPLTLPLRERKLLGVARALASEPELLLLDEPVGGLSVEEVEEFGKTILNIRGQGMTILLIEHRIELVMAISDQVLVMNFGKNIFEGAPQEVQRNEQVISAYLGEDWTTQYGSRR